MTRAEVAMLLSAAAARDQRTIGEADVLAWHEDVGDLDYADAREALRRHFRESEARLMPVHIRRVVAEIVKGRHRGEREAQERRAIAAYAETAGPLTDRRPEIKAYVAEICDVLPEGDPVALRPRMHAWEREHRAYVRSRNAEPNPNYNAAAPPIPDWQRSKNPPPGCWWEDEKKRERHSLDVLAKAGRIRLCRCERCAVTDPPPEETP